jgi:hypothetical protein
MTRHSWAFCVLLSLGWLAHSASRARAYEEQASADFALGYSGVVDSDSLSTRGMLADLGASLGISDMFVLRGNFGYAGYWRNESVRSAGRFRLEAAYLLDILRWVPFFGVGGSLWLYDDRSLTVRPAWHMVVGLDFLYDRAWTVGVDLRSGVLWERSGGRSATDVSLRLSRMFDLF